MEIDSTIDKIIKKLAKKHNVSYSQVFDTLSFYFSKFKVLINLPSLPKIMINKFGTFKAEPKLISKYIKYNKERFENNELDKEPYEYFNIPELEKALERRTFEEQKNCANKKRKLFKDE